METNAARLPDETYLKCGVAVIECINCEIKMIHKVIDIRQLSPSAYVLRLERNRMSFAPGQCVTLGIRGGGINREYSIYSGQNDDYLDFLIKEIPSGLVSEALHRVAPGQEMDMYGPYGDFTIPPERQAGKPVVLIGTGTGISPLHSFVRSWPNLNYTLMHGARTASECYDYSDYVPSRLHACLTREKKPGCWNGRVTSYLAQGEVAPDAGYYLCGRSEMISDTADLLIRRGVPSNNIFTETFF